MRAGADKLTSQRFYPFSTLNDSLPREAVAKSRISDSDSKVISVAQCHSKFITTRHASIAIKSMCPGEFTASRKPHAIGRALLCTPSPTIHRRPPTRNWSVLMTVALLLHACPIRREGRQVGPRKRSASLVKAARSQPAFLSQHILLFRSKLYAQGPKRSPSW